MHSLSKANAAIIAGLGAVLFIANGLLLVQVQRLRREVDGRVGVRPEALMRLLAAEVPTGTGTRLRLGTTHARYIALIALTPTDCAPCMAGLTGLNRIGTMRSDVAVYGLVSYGNANEIEQTRANLSLAFPMIDDGDGRWFKALNIPGTPWKVIFDRKRRAILYEDPPSVTKEQSEAFLQRIAALGR